MEPTAHDRLQGKAQAAAHPQPRVGARRALPRGLRAAVQQARDVPVRLTATRQP
jgi:hypothetical protein